VGGGKLDRLGFQEELTFGLSHKEQGSQMPVAPSCNPSYQEAEIRRIVIRSQPMQIVLGDPISRKPFTKKRLVEWLKV
jgi:hypothetical protein